MRLFCIQIEKFSECPKTVILIEHTNATILNVVTKSEIVDQPLKGGMQINSLQ